MKSIITTVVAAAITILSSQSLTVAQNIAVCEIAPVDESWIETLKKEKKSELDLHIDYIHRVCELDAKQLAKLRVASKMVVGKLIKIAEEQQEGMIGIEPAIAIPEAAVFEDSEEEPVDETDTTEAEEVDETDAESTDEEDPAAIEGEFNQIANVLMAAMPANDENWADQEFLYGRSLTTYPDWLKKVNTVLTDGQKAKLKKANKERLEQTLKSVVDRNTIRVSNAFYLTAEQTEKIRALCEKKLREQITNEFNSMGQVYDYDGMLYSVTSPEEVADILNESQMKRWHVIAGNWQGGFGQGGFGGFGQIEIAPEFIDEAIEVIED